MSGRTCLFIAVLSLGLALAPSGFAQDDPFASLTDAEVEVALGLLDGAEQAEAAEDWEAAIRAYRALAAIVEVPEAQLREADALARGGYPADAERLYLRLAGSDVSQVAGAATEALVQLRSDHPAQVELRGLVEGATIAVNGAPPVPAPVGGQSLALPAGREHRLIFAADGFESQTIEAEFAIASAITLDVVLEPIAPNELTAALPATEPVLGATGGEDRDARGARWAVPASLGAVALGAGTTALVFGQRAKDRARAHNADPAGDPGNMLADEAQSARTVSYVLGGVAGASAVAALVAVITSPRDAASASVAVSPTRGGARFDVAVRW